jgi:hypothetical protein
VRGGPGIDDYEANLLPDGLKGSAEITDVGKGEHVIVWTGNGSFMRVDTAGIGQVGTLAEASIQGHDVGHFSRRAGGAEGFLLDDRRVGERASAAA